MRQEITVFSLPLETNYLSLLKLWRRFLLLNLASSFQWIYTNLYLIIKKINDHFKCSKEKNIAFKATYFFSNQSNNCTFQLCSTLFLTTITFLQKTEVSHHTAFKYITDSILIRSIGFWQHDSTTSVL